VNDGHAKLVWNGLAEGTRNGYRSAQRTYVRSCALQGVQPWPATLPAICTWLTERLLGAGGSAPIKPDSALSELSALRAYHIDHNLPDVLFDVHAKHFRRMIDGARRMQPYYPKRTRDPITRSAIMTLSENISQLPPHPTTGSTLSAAQKDDLNIAAAARVAFAGFLRVGEFTYSASDRRNTHVFASTKLTRSDIRFSTTRDHALLTLKRSKTDRNHEGVNIVLAATNDAACPVDALSKLLTHDLQPPSSPLFSLSNGTFTSSAFQSAVISKLRRSGGRTEGIKGHSFRKGAAQHAHNAGIRNDHIQALGRWTSDAFRLYFSTSPTTLYSWNRQFQTGQLIPVSHHIPD
jgi:integrase